MGKFNHKILRDHKGKSKLPLVKSRLFWTGVALKLIVAALFASEFLHGKFAPFGDKFIADGLQDPYAYFAAHGTGLEFPYPPLMLFIFSLPRLILSPLTGVDPAAFGILESLIYRIPILMADLVILFVLIRWLKTRIRQVLIWYWLSPVLFYINYFHGQLDVIPIAALFVSLYLLFRNQWLLAYIALAAAVGCKTNMILVLPFYLLYQFRYLNRDYRKTLISFMLFLLVVLTVNLPFIGSAGFLKMVYNNPVQNQIFDLFYQFNSNLRIYFIPAVFFILVLWYYSLKFVNKDQLILFLTFSFLALTLMVAPMQGWYYWIFPLLIYFIIKHGHQEKRIFVVLNLLYFTYFYFAPGCDYFNSCNISEVNQATGFLMATKHKPMWLNVSFTLLQTTLFLTGFLVYRKGISSNIQMKFLSQPYLIGIGGDSAAGKSTLTKNLIAIFSESNTTVIRGDDMHKWERGNENWKTHTHLNPKANQIHTDLQHTRQLKTGQTIQRRYYDHNTGRFTLPKFIRPNKLIIFEGLHSFFLNNQSEIYDLKIYMEPQEDLRKWWKVKRDVAKRNYTPGQVMDQLLQREEDSEKYIRSQKMRADLIISFFSENPLDVNKLDVQPEIGVSVLIPEDVQMDLLLFHLLKCHSFEVEHSFSEGKQLLLAKGNISSVEVGNTAMEALPELEEIGVNNPDWKDGYEGFLQLITVYVIFSKIQSVHAKKD